MSSCNKILFLVKYFRVEKWPLVYFSFLHFFSFPWMQPYLLWGQAQSQHKAWSSSRVILYSTKAWDRERRRVKWWKCVSRILARLFCPWDSPGKNTREGRHALLQGVFLTQGLNPCLMSATSAGGFFTTSATWGALLIGYTGSFACNLHLESEHWMKYSTWHYSIAKADCKPNCYCFIILKMIIPPKQCFLAVFR